MVPISAFFASPKSTGIEGLDCAVITWKWMHCEQAVHYTWLVVQLDLPLIELQFYKVYFYNNRYIMECQ